MFLKGMVCSFHFLLHLCQVLASLVKRIGSCFFLFIFWKSLCRIDNTMFSRTPSEAVWNWSFLCGKGFNYEVSFSTRHQAIGLPDFPEWAFSHALLRDLSLSVCRIYWHYGVHIIFSSVGTIVVSLFILGPRWVFVALHRFSLAVASGGFFVTGRWLLTAVASLAAEHRLQVQGLQQLQVAGLAAPRRVESSWTRDWTAVLCIGRWILIRLPPEKVLPSLFGIGDLYQLFLDQWSHDIDFLLFIFDLSVILYLKWNFCRQHIIVAVVQSLKLCSTLVTSWTVTCQAPLSATISWSLLKFLLVMLSNHLILCHPLHLLPQSFLASGSFPVRLPFVSLGQIIGASATVLPYSGLISFRKWFPLGLVWSPCCPRDSQ